MTGLHGGMLLELLQLLLPARLLVVLSLHEPISSFGVRVSLLGV